MATPARTGRPRVPGAWSNRQVLRVLGLAVLVYVAVRLAWTISSVLLLTFLGVLFGLALTAAVDQLHRLKIPRVVATAGILLTAIGALAGIGRLVAPAVVEQGRAVSEQLPQAVERLRGWINSQREGVVGLLTEPGDTAQQRPQGERAAPADEEMSQSAFLSGLGEVGQRFFAIFSSTLAAVGGLLLALFVAIYIAVDPTVYERGLIHLVPHAGRRRAGEVLRRVAYMLRRWLLAQAVAMLAVGILTTVVLVVLDVQGALALGLIAGLLEFVPIAGPIIASVPGIGMALLDGVDKALYVTLAYVAIQQIEAQLITPVVMKEGLDIPPVLTIVGQAAMAIVFGFLGLLVAVPLIGATLVIVKMVYVRDVVGDRVPIPGDGSS